MRYLRNVVFFLMSFSLIVVLSTYSFLNYITSESPYKTEEGIISSYKLKKDKIIAIVELPSGPLKIKNKRKLIEFSINDPICVRFITKKIPGVGKYSIVGDIDNDLSKLKSEVTLNEELGRVHVKIQEWAKEIIFYLIYVSIFLIVITVCFKGLIVNS